MNVGKVNKAWAKEKSYFIPPNPGTVKYANARGFIEKAMKNGVAVQQSRMNRDGSFTDGRHRFAALRDMGVRNVVVSVDKSVASTVRRRFGP